MAHKRPLGVWIIALGVMGGSLVLLVPELFGATWMAQHYGMSLFESGFWNVLSLLAMAVASGVGLLWGRPHARVAILVAILAPAATFTFSIQSLVHMVRDSDPELLTSMRFWVRLWMLPIALIISGAGSAMYLFLNSKCRTFYEQAGA